MKTILSFLLALNTCIAFTQTQQFSGTWTKKQTTYLFEFDLLLKINPANQVEGYFIWKAVQYDEFNPNSINYYRDKIGKTAKEFVKGTYDPAKGSYILQGYKKEDPHLIIGIDRYELTLDKQGNLGGNTKANGTWLGRINGKQVEMDIL